MFLIKRRSKRFRGKSFLDIASSQEDMVSQVFFLLALFSLGVTLSALNRDMGDLVEWQTIILFTTIVGFFIAYYFKILYCLPVSIISFIIWWGVKAADWVDGKDIRSSVVFAGAVLISLSLYVVGNIHKINWKFKRFSLVYVVFGIISVTAFLFFLSNRWGMQSLQEMTEGKMIFGSWQITVSFLVIVLSLVLSLGYTFFKKYISKYEAATVACVAGFFVCLPFFPQLQLFETSSAYRDYYFSAKEFSSFGIIWAFTFNVFIFLEILGIILLGYIQRQEWLINLGALFLFILIGVKYFDWFFTFFDKSIFFISAGIILFIVGWFMEKGRKYMLSITKEEHDNKVESIN